MGNDFHRLTPEEIAREEGMRLACSLRHSRRGESLSMFEFQVLFRYTTMLMRVEHNLFMIADIRSRGEGQSRMFFNQLDELEEYVEALEESIQRSLEKVRTVPVARGWYQESKKMVGLIEDGERDLWDLLSWPEGQVRDRVYVGEGEPLLGVW